MRLWFCSFAPFALVALVVACNTVDPSECWPNTSGGFGGSGSIPIGAGVGVSSGDFISPRPGPLGYGAPANPCVTAGDDTARSGGAGGAVPSMGSVWSYFRPTNFAFVTIVADDGKDPAGGWQESTTVLTLADGLTTVYSCKVHVGMPMRTQLLGKISPIAAATMSATVANAAAALSWPTTYPQGIFCSRFTTEMTAQFANLYPIFGARMMP